MKIRKRGEEKKENDRTRKRRIEDRLDKGEVEWGEWNNRAGKITVELMQSQECNGIEYCRKQCSAH